MTDKVDFRSKTACELLINLLVYHPDHRSPAANRCTRLHASSSAASLVA
jgi:hypothetical protein